MCRFDLLMRCLDLIAFLVWWLCVHCNLEATGAEDEGEGCIVNSRHRLLRLSAALRVGRARIACRSERKKSCGRVDKGRKRGVCVWLWQDLTSSKARRRKKCGTLIMIFLLLGQSAIHVTRGPMLAVVNDSCLHRWPKNFGGSCSRTDDAMEWGSGQVIRLYSICGREVVSRGPSPGPCGHRIGEAKNPGPAVVDYDQAEVGDGFLQEEDEGGWDCGAPAGWDEFVDDCAYVDMNMEDFEGHGVNRDHRLEEVDRLIELTREWQHGDRKLDPLEAAAQDFFDKHGCDAGPEVRELPDRGGLGDSSGHSRRPIVTDPWAKARAQEAAHKADKWLAASAAYAARIAANRVGRRSGGASGGAETAGKIRVFKQCELPYVPILEEDAADAPLSPAASGHGRPMVATRAEALSPEAARRPRGRRQRGRRSGEVNDIVQVWSLNSSGSPQLKAAVNYARHHAPTKPAVILSQEHHATTDRLPDLQNYVKRLGWRMSAVKAVATDRGGSSAGVAVLVPSHVSAGVDQAASLDGSPASSPGRFASQWIQELVPCGFMAASCYLHTLEGGTARNVEILTRGLGIMKASGCPWIVALDAQQHPPDFLKWAAPAIERAGGTVVHADEPTHYPGVGEGKCMDFFIVDNSIASAVKKVEVEAELTCSDQDGTVYTVAAKPHRLVRLELRSQAVQRVQTMLKLPRKFAMAKPCGCARHPHAPDGEAMEAITPTDSKEQQMEAVSKAWVPIVKCIEVELCGLFDLFKGSEPDHRYCTRGQAVGTVERSTMPRRAAGDKGHMSQRDYALVWALNRLTELRALAAKEQAGQVLGEGRLRQWKNVVRKICSPASPVGLHGDGRWMTFLGQLREHAHEPAKALDLISSTVDWVTIIIENDAARRRAKGKQAWARWLAAQRKAGGAGGAAHRFVKRVEEDPDIVLRVGGRRTVTPQSVVDSEWETWNTVWSKLQAHGDAPWRTNYDMESLPCLTADVLRAAALTFKEATGVGVDGISPKQCAWLSDELLSSLACYFIKLESVGVWPQQVQQALIHLIPKASGGRRPIGVLPTLVRVWERARRSQVIAWRRSCNREYNWMSPGRGAERSVWAQSIHEEAARARGDMTASVLIDLVKAFEMIVLSHVWNKGLVHRFPVQILRLSLETCSFARRLTYRGAVSKVSNTLTAIIAGGGMATDLLFVALVDAVDALIIRHEAKVFMIADDIRLVVEGRELDVVDRVQVLAEDAIDMLEHSLHMEVSRDKPGVEGKTVAIASTASGRKRIAGGMSRLGIRVKTIVRNLGVDFAAGKASRRIARPTQAKRVREAKRKRDRATRLGRKLEHEVVKTAIIPSIIYGSAATGITDGMCSALRRSVAASLGPVAGRSATVRLLVENVDPALTIIMKPVMEWVCAVWDALVVEDVMIAAWRLAATEVGLAARPHAAVTGGAGALWAALRRLGWTMPSHDTIKVQDSTILFFGTRGVPDGTTEVDPSTIRKYISDEYATKALLDSQVARDLADVAGVRGYPRVVEQEARQGVGIAASRAYGSASHEEHSARVWRRGRFEFRDDRLVPWVWPIASVVKAAKKAKRYTAAASLRSLAEGGWRTQRRLWAEGRAAHERCVCKQASGTLWHKLAACSLSEQWRNAACPDWILKIGRASVWDPLFSRAIPARPKPVAAAAEMTWWQAADMNQERVMTGEVYTDGASRGPFWRAARAGWAAVALDHEGKWVATLSGTLGGPHVSAFRAELKAVLEVLRIALPPITIYCDNAAVVRGFANGKDGCISSRARGADLWRRVWFLLDELGDEVRIVKVKAHTTWADVLLLRVRHIDHVGNDLADKAAKMAAQAAEAESPTSSFNGQLRKALVWLRWVLDYLTGWVDDVEPLPEQHQEELDAKQGELCRLANAPKDGISHELWRVGSCLMCRRCEKSGEGEVEEKQLGASVCGGSAAGRAATIATGNINYRWWRFAVSVNALEQQGARKITTTRVPAAAVDHARLREVTRSAEQYEQTLGMLRGEAGISEHSPVTGAASSSSQPPPKRHKGSAQENVGRTSEGGRGRKRKATSPVREESIRDMRSRAGSGHAYLDDETQDDDRPIQEQYVMPWERPPEWLPSWIRDRAAMDADQDESSLRGGITTSVADGAHTGASTVTGRGTHVIAFAGPVAYCVRCANYAKSRVGSGLKGPCARPQFKTLNAVAARLARLRQGKHPITGAPLT